MSRSSSGAATRLATYGTLAPGRVNNHQLSNLQGRWREGRVKGRLIEAGWGAGLGYPGLVLDPQGADIDVQLFESPDLPGHWDRLDAFEGAGYRRVVADIATDEGDVPASIYVIDN